MPSLPASTHVGRVGLNIAEPGSAADFYESVVGLHRLDGDNEQRLGVGEIPLIELAEAPNTPPRPTSAAGLFHLAIRVPDRASLADALGRFRQANALAGASDHHVSEALYGIDPENNGIEVYRDRPRDDWTHSPDGRVTMVTDPLALDDLAAIGTGAKRVPPGTDVGHVHLEVTDMAQARDFYVETLGFDVMASFPGALFVGAGGYHHHVGLNTWNRRNEPTSGRGLDFVEFVLPTAGDVDTVVTRLDAAGTSIDERDDHVRLTDPDGIELRLVAGRPAQS